MHKKRPALAQSLPTAVAILLSFTNSGFAQGDPPTYEAQLINGAPTLDGVVSPGEWNAAEPETFNHVLRGGQNQTTTPNHEFRILWNEEAMYVLIETNLANWPGGTGGFDANNNINFYIDPNNDGEPNGTGGNMFDGYHPVIYPDTGMTSRFSTAFDDLERSIFTEASINANFGGSDWPAGASTEPGVTIDYVSNVGATGGVIEICIPWLIFDSMAGTDMEIYHPFAPELDEQWYMQLGIISAGPELLPIWSWTPAQIFAARPHGVVTFTGTPVPFIITEFRRDNIAGISTMKWNSKPNKLYTVRLSLDLGGSWLELEDGIEPLFGLLDVTRPGDPVILVNGSNDGDGDSGAPPPNEGVGNTIDGTDGKYLNFLDLNSGFIVTPFCGPSTVSSIRLYTANDSPERDPASYELFGSNTGTAEGDFTLIADGPLTLPLERNNGGGAAIDPATSINQQVTFKNTVAYKHYKLIFPTLRDATAANSMQIGEVELLQLFEGTTGFYEDAIFAPPGTEKAFYRIVEEEN